VAKMILEYPVDNTDLGEEGSELENLMHYISMNMILLATKYMRVTKEQLKNKTLVGYTLRQGIN